MLRLARRWLMRPAPWTYVPEGFDATSKSRGWDMAAVVKAEVERWPRFIAAIAGAQPLSANHEDPAVNGNGLQQLRSHNVLASYAYVVARAAHGRERLRVLDWGGGLGHYYLITRAVLPEVELDYTCHDLPLFCEAGRELLPQVHFFADDAEALSSSFDLVVAGSSLWYVPQWRGKLRQLAQAADPFLYLTRMLFTRQASSYVALQRPYASGYPTEYLCWILNRAEFLGAAAEAGLELQREFFISDGPYIHRAPEQPDYRGFLFTSAEPGHEAR